MAAELAIADRTVAGKTYRNCFYGKDAVTWLMGLGYADDEGDAVAICSSMISRGLMEGSTGDTPFRNDASLFTFTKAVPLPKAQPKVGQETAESRRDAQIRQLEELLDQWDTETGNPEDTDKIIEKVLASRRSRRQAGDVGLNQLSASDIHAQSSDSRKRMLQFLPFEDIQRATVFTRRSSMSVTAITPERAMAITKDGASAQQHRANRPVVTFRFAFDQFSGCLLFLNPEQGNVEAAILLCEVWEVRRNVHPKGTDPTLAARTLGLWQAGMTVCLPLTFEDATTHDLWAHCLTLLLNIAHSPAPSVTQWLRREWILAREATDGALPGRVGLEMIERALGHPKGGLDQNLLAKHMIADGLTPPAFLNLFVELTVMPRLVPIFAALVGGAAGGMNRAAFVEFLVHVQKESEDRIQSILAAYFPKEDRLMKELDFAIFLLAPHNSCFDPRHMQICDDMTQPLSHYYVASSHNTYLLEDQLKSPSSVEGYVRALLLKCRCVELDVWDGSDGYPRVTHGHTLCSSIGAKEALEIIREYAFATSSYPLILSFENHCSPTQESRLATLCDDIFGNMVVTSRNSKPKRFDRLPSPEELRGRILIKARVSTAIKELVPPQTDLPITPLSPPGTPHKSQSQSLSVRLFGSSSNLCLPTLGNSNSRLSSSSDTSISRIDQEGKPRSNSTRSRSNSSNAAPVSDSLKPRASHRRKGSEGLQLEDFLKDDPMELMKKTASIREAQRSNSKEVQKQTSRELQKQNSRELQKQSSKDLQKQSSRELKRSSSLESHKAMSRELVTLEQALQGYNERSGTQLPDVVTLEQMLESPRNPKDWKFDFDEDSSMRRMDMADADAQSRTGSQRSRKTQAQRTPSFTAGANLTLTDLTLYCISASYKGLCPGLDVQAYNEMGSFGEDKAKKLASTHGKKWIRHNTIYFSRIYPSGKRVNSSNYCPQSLWNAGCQMVALNYQTSDRPMALNQARFGQYNGGCGYVLKPPSMRDPAALMYSFRAAKEKTTEKEEPIVLTLQVLSSQFIALAKDESPNTKINLVIKVDGCTNDLCWRQSHRLRNAPFVPDWQFKTIFHLEEPSHAILSFYVVKSHKSYGKKVEKDVAHYGLPVKSLLQGYRMVPLLNMQHDRMASDYLLVYVTKTPQTNIYARPPQPNNVS